MEERLRKFACLADSGSFTKAAARLHVSQPALSTAVAKLERELKATLFVRGARPLALTPAGELAYRSAKELAVQTGNLKLRLAELASEPVALSVGMIDSIAHTLFSHGAGLELAKGAQVSLVVNNSRYLMTAAERGEVDVAFIARPSGALPATLEAWPVADEPLVIVSRTAGQQKDSQLANFIAYDQPSNTFRLVNEALKKHGITPHIGFYSTSPDVTLRLLLSSHGTAALPYLLVREYLADGRLVSLGGQTPWLIPRPIVMLRRRDRALPASLDTLKRQTAHILAELAADAKAGYERPRAL